jgi:hypothetical protein
MVYAVGKIPLYKKRVKAAGDILDGALSSNQISTLSQWKALEGFIQGEAKLESDIRAGRLTDPVPLLCVDVALSRGTYEVDSNAAKRAIAREKARQQQPPSEELQRLLIEAKKRMAQLQTPMVPESEMLSFQESGRQIQQLMDLLKAGENSPNPVERHGYACLFEIIKDRPPFEILSLVPILRTPNKLADHQPGVARVDDKHRLARMRSLILVDGHNSSRQAALAVVRGEHGGIEPIGMDSEVTRLIRRWSTKMSLRLL